MNSENYLNSYHKIHKIREGIDSFEKFQDPIFSISAFILRLQIAEYELKNLCKMVCVHDDEKISEMPLGQLIGYTKKIEPELFTAKQYQLLDEMNNARRKFIHHLFSDAARLTELADESKSLRTICVINIKNIELVMNKVLNKIKQTDGY